MLFSAINYPLCFWEGTRRNCFCLEWWLLLGGGTGRRHCVQSLTKTTLSAVAPCGSDRNFNGTGQKGTRGCWLLSLTVGGFLQPWECLWSRLADGIRKAALSFDRVTWMCDLIVVSPPHGSWSSWGGNSTACVRSSLWDWGYSSAVSRLDDPGFPLQRSITNRPGDLQSQHSGASEAQGCPQLHRGFKAGPGYLRLRK